MQPHGDGLFRWTSPSPLQGPSRVRLADGEGVRERYDLYGFAPSIAPEVLYLLNEGRLLQAHRMLGAHACQRDGRL